MLGAFLGCFSMFWLTLDGKNDAQDPPLLPPREGEAQLIVDIPFQQDYLAVFSLASPRTGYHATECATILLLALLFRSDPIVRDCAVRSSIGGS